MQSPPIRAWLVRNSKRRYDRRFDNGTFLDAGSIPAASTIYFERYKMQTIMCIKDYPMCGTNIPKGLILGEIEETSPGKSSYKDDKENIYTFDNSEILFSKTFKESFIRLKK